MTTWQQDAVDATTPLNRAFEALLVDVKVVTRYIGSECTVTLRPEGPDDDPEVPIVCEVRNPAGRAWKKLVEAYQTMQRFDGSKNYSSRYYHPRAPHGVWRVSVEPTDVAELGRASTPKRPAESTKNEFSAPPIGETTAVVRHYETGRETVVRGGAVQVNELPAMTVITVWKDAQ